MSFFIKDILGQEKTQDAQREAVPAKGVVYKSHSITPAYKEYSKTESGW